MTSNEIRQKFLTFFSAKGGPALGGKHVIVPSSSLIPDDPSVLLTTAGMQQFKPYYTGKADPMKDFGSKNTTTVQKSFRTSDIEEVGDERHLTFFEMLGNFSFGGYFKKEAIEYAYHFLTDSLEKGGMGLEISYVTIFSAQGGSLPTGQAGVSGGEGSSVVPTDEESRNIWQSLGVTKIEEQGMEDVFWGPTGSGGPCGPTTEIYCKNGAGQDIEVWNIVFNEFFFSGSREELNVGTSGKKLEPLPVPGVDTGMGLERLAMISQGTNTVFETDLFMPIIQKLGSSSDIHKRIIADHARGIVFLIGDGVQPSNKEQGYILRRLMRRTIPHLHEHANLFEKTDSFWVSFKDVLQSVIDVYSVVDEYKYLISKKDYILSLAEQEEVRFRRVYENGKNILEKLIHQSIEAHASKLSGKDIFDLVTTHGFVLDWIKDVAKEYSISLDIPGFEAEFKKHQEISRAGQEAKFGGHGLILDTGELKASTEEEVKIVTRLHTATHLLQATLRKVLGEEVHQMGSDITAERTRFDFSFLRKVTKEELIQVERMVNEAIEHDYTVEAKKMPYEEAIKTGALYFFRDKYPEEVNVYTVHDPKNGEVFSREFCGGPHVSHTGEIGHFRIIKEESSSAGVRRIRATVQ